VEEAVKYSMQPIESNTRVRTEHNTYGQIVTSVMKDQILIGDDVWTATEAGPEVFVGDKWMRVTHIGDYELSNPGWAALIHKGKAICRNFKEIDETTCPDPPVNENEIYQVRKWNHINKTFGDPKYLEVTDDPRPA
jgi:hypothetical protein